DGPVVVSLSASHPLGAPLTFSAEAQSLAYVLDQQYGFSSDGDLREDWGGRRERWFQDADGWWYFILPSGRVFQWGGGDGATGPRIATVGASYYDDPSLVYDAEPDQPHAALGVADDTLTIEREDGFLGSFVVTVTASDGELADSQSFTVTVAGRR